MKYFEKLGFDLELKLPGDFSTLLHTENQGCQFCDFLNHI